MTDEVEQNVPGALTADLYTETLARLYFQQGFGPEALHIYRHLARERPNDQRLQERVRTLTQQLDSAWHSQPAPSDAGLSALAADASGDATAYQTRQIIVHLERWLHALRRQRQA